MTPATRLLEAARASTRNASPRENLTERERELLDAVEALSDARALYPAAHAIGDRVSVPARPDEDILPELRLPFSGDVTAVTFHEAGVRYEVHHPRAGYVDVDSAFVHPAPESPPVRPSIESLFPDVLNAYHCDGQRLPGGGWSVVHRATGKTGTLPQSAIILGPEAVGTWLSEFSDPAPVELGCLTGGQVGAYAGMGLAELRMHEWSVDVGAEQNRCPACRAETKAGHRAGCLLHEAINARLAAIGYSCEPDGTLTITDPPLSHEATAIDRFIAEELPGRRAEFVGTLPDVAREVYAAATGVAEGSPASSIADVQKTTFDPAVHGNTFGCLRLGGHIFDRCQRAADHEGPCVPASKPCPDCGTPPSRPHQPGCPTAAKQW